MSKTVRLRGGQNLPARERFKQLRPLPGEHHRHDRVYTVMTESSDGLGDFDLFRTFDGMCDSVDRLDAAGIKILLVGFKGVNP